MSKLLSFLLITLCALNGWAQAPLLKTVEKPDAATPSLRADGFLGSHWTQDYPYNQLCPRDPVNGNAFDDDWASLKFPSFPQLNEMLDSIDATFQRGEGLHDELAAALVFACGTACTQVYTSEGSGTFYVDQAYEAYQRFGFTDCVLYREPSDEMYATLISNLQAGYPAHLAVENPAGTVGHNVVVDGYRESDGKFHINFGYGGTLDNWYDIPDPNFYYGMTKVEGIILNIIPKDGPLAVHESTAQQPLEVYPNPVSDILFIKNLPCKKVEFSIFNMLGQEVTTGYSAGTISVAGWEKGIYFLQVKGENFWETAKFVVK